MIAVCIMALAVAVVRLRNQNKVHLPSGLPQKPVSMPFTGTYAASSTGYASISLSVLQSSGIIKAGSYNGKVGTPIGVSAEIMGPAELDVRIDSMSQVCIISHSLDITTGRGTSLTHAVEVTLNVPPGGFINYYVLCKDSNGSYQLSELTVNVWNPATYGTEAMSKEALTQINLPGLNSVP